MNWKKQVDEIVRHIEIIEIIEKNMKIAIFKSINKSMYL